MANIALLKPKVRQMCERLIVATKKDIGLEIAITSTFRTVKEQDALYAQGRTKPGKRVTNARGGYSMHNYGVAFDFCPITDGKLNWDDLSLFDKVGKIGEKIGLEWGGNWKKMIDRPHFQFTAGYKIKDFVANKIDWKKFDIDATDSKIPDTPVDGTVKTYKVTAKNGLLVRKGPGTSFEAIGKLQYGKVVLPKEIKDGWIKIEYNNNSGYVSASFVTAS